MFGKNLDDRSAAQILDKFFDFLSAIFGFQISDDFFTHLFKTGVAGRLAVGHFDNVPANPAAKRFTQFAGLKRFDGSDKIRWHTRSREPIEITATWLGAQVFGMFGGERGEVGLIFSQLAVQLVDLLLAPGRIIADRAQENVSCAIGLSDAEAIFRAAFAIVVVPLPGGGFSNPGGRGEVSFQPVDLRGEFAKALAALSGVEMLRGRTLL